MIIQSGDLTGQIPLEPQVLDGRAKTWTDYLQSVGIGLEDLDEVFRLTVAKHNNNFPMSAFNLNATWQEIKTERAEKEAATTYIKFCGYGHTDKANAKMKVVNPYEPEEDLILPCSYCQPEEYKKANALLHEANSHRKPVDLLDYFVEKLRLEKEAEQNG